MGVEAYIAKVDITHLSDPNMWTDAAGMIFFGLGVTLGCQIAYGGAQRIDRPVPFPTLSVSIGNSIFSFVAGFSIFAIMGFLVREKNSAHPQFSISVSENFLFPYIAYAFPNQVNEMGTSFENMDTNLGGFSLLFISFPAALARLPFGVSHFFSVWFFLFLLMLGNKFTIVYHLLPPPTLP